MTELDFAKLLGFKHLGNVARKTELAAAMGTSFNKIGETVPPAGPVTVLASNDEEIPRS